ncbi:MAG: 30S ribosomal protein S16 [Clostridia bacterium]|nr:30S ribosomal protein S16 [Clostridia bacterium]
MAVKMRLTRMGDKKNPFYRIVVIDGRKARDGQYFELLGTYDPLTDPATIKIDEERAKYWLNNGVQPTDTVRDLLHKQGIIEDKKMKNSK